MHLCLGLWISSTVKSPRISKETKRQEMNRVMVASRFSIYCNTGLKHFVILILICRWEANDMRMLKRPKSTAQSFPESNAMVKEGSLKMVFPA